MTDREPQTTDRPAWWWWRWPATLMVIAFFATISVTEWAKHLGACR